MKVIVTGCLLLGCFLIAESIVCYQCADSSSDTKASSCYGGTRNLQKMRIEYETNNVSLDRLPNIKNCNNYPGAEYCKIETVEAFGRFTAYIRDCSDGKTFSLNVSRLDNVPIDNQSTCAYSATQGATICVTVCNGTLCNGPNMASYMSGSALTMLLLAIVGMVLVAL